MDVAFGVFALDGAVEQEHSFFRVEKPFDDVVFDFTVGSQRAVSALEKPFVFRGTGVIIIVVADKKTGEVGEVSFAYFGNHVFGRDILLLRDEHHGCAMGVVGVAAAALVAAQFLRAYPNVDLDMLDHVVEVDAVVGTG